ncbi:alkaline phosphatase family protein [Amycolatopsis sp. H20-H5]|uniref:alkaline phosphatase family protein n=1 Tax=Amycolatopsis sp. H20-H5 TaxID=3046309 RepID=UPI002DBA1A08|nr:alkaline phosphatase family protein [Amycolatopsis sp. H20-H5]MEC3976207.1 alkaline phosphatase family protein [Amycolatopsis sp. H20-H5]
MSRAHRGFSLLAAGLTIAASGPVAFAPLAHASTGIPRPDHVLVVVLENEQRAQIIGNPDAPYINSLADTGANFTESYAITHPSQPNYLALYSGDTQGVTSDACPNTFDTDNLGQQLIAANLSFTGYSEDLPSDDPTSCGSGGYARKHNPWVNFTNVPAEDNQPFSNFPSDYSTLPTVFWVIPNLCNDMHDCSVSTGDSWLKNNLDGYVQWANEHNSVLITTFDEDDSNGTNQITTLFNGQPVTPGSYDRTIDHYSVLRTVEDMYGLPYAGNAAQATSITNVWGSGTASEQRRTRR